MRSEQHAQDEARRPTTALRPQMEPVGTRIRAQRIERELSVRGLARASGVSASMISQVELEKASPSIPTLCSIVAVLDMSLDELFAPAGKRDPRTPSAPHIPAHPIGWEAPSDGPVLRRSNRLKLRLGPGVLLERLTAHAVPGVEFLHLTYLPGAESSPVDAPVAHGGSEYGVVVGGRLGATIGGDSYALEPGDSISFAATEPHRLWTIGDEVATAIWMVRGREDDPRIP